MAFRHTTKGRYVIERREHALAPWRPIQGCDGAIAAQTLLDWFRLHHGEFSAHRHTGVEHRLVDTQDGQDDGEVAA